ncbi:MAG: OadG family protein [Salinivirgaceae bacterium]|nr:OadG family protein [Salinivirgaceae bacterium]
MEGNVLEALKLLCVGLTTVFVVLLLIIMLGNSLIAFVNRFIPEDEKPIAKQAPSAISPKVANAIAAAVAQLTGGQGKVEKIEKI